jgi:hypothetical protein
MRRIEDRLHPEEPWFTLRGQDLLAPHAVEAYASLLRATAAGLRHRSEDRERFEDLLEQANEASRVASEMVSWQAQHPDIAKLPD